MRLDETEARRLFADAPVARLATVDSQARPHLVPVVFAVRGSRVVFAIDHKPKDSRNLKRLNNIRHNPRVSLLVDRYDDDWSRLWWVRADGAASIHSEPAEMAEPIDWLVAKYPQYQRIRPEGPAVLIEVDRWTGWAGDNSVS
jgi:PPOX class probable F420-dependent enzyme